MALINDSMQQDQPDTPAPDAAPAAPASGAQDSSNPKSIQKRLGATAMKIIYDKKVSDKLVAMLKAGAQNPAQTVAEAALGILNRMKKDVQGINPDLVFSISAIVVIFILELAAASKAFQVDQSTLKDSMTALAALAKQEKGGAPQPAQPGSQPAPGAQPVIPAAPAAAQPMGA